MATVLVVDSGAVMRAHVARALAERGCIVIESPGIQSGYELAVAKRPHVVFTNHSLPEIDGIGLVRALRLNPSFKITPLIVYAIGAEETTRQACLRAGATGCIVDVHTPPSLYGILVEHLAYR